MFVFLKRRRFHHFGVIDFILRGCFQMCAVEGEEDDDGTIDSQNPYLQSGFYDANGNSLSTKQAQSLQRQQIFRKTHGGILISITESEYNSLQESEQTDLSAEFKEQELALGREQLQASREASARQTLLGLLQIGLSGRMVTLEEQKYIDQERRAKQQDERATEMWNRYKELYLPGETAWVKESFAGIPVDQMLNRATADVQTAYDKTTDQLGRNMSRMGINASSPKYTGLMSAVARDRSLAEVDTRNRSRLAVNDLNWERRRQATGMGSGMPLNASGITTQAAGIMGRPGSMFGAAQQGLASASNTLQGASNTLAQGYNPLMNAYNTASSGSLSMAQSYLGANTSLSNNAANNATARRGQGLDFVSNLIPNFGWNSEL